MRIVRRTLLVVGEGYAEVAFLKHIRNLYSNEQNASSMMIANARGAGAQHVVPYAVKAARFCAHDQVAVLLNAPVDWNERVAALARTKKISVLVALPCLESPLLHVHGGRSEQPMENCKKDFQERFGGEIDGELLLEKFFRKEVLDEARGRVPMLDQLLTLLSV